MLICLKWHIGCPIEFGMRQEYNFYDSLIFNAFRYFFFQSKTTNFVLGMILFGLSLMNKQVYVLKMILFLNESWVDIGINLV